MNVLQLRETIKELLTESPDLTGDYTLPDNTTIPAIYVTGRQSVPAEWEVTGLEAIIREFPDLLPSPMVGTIQSRKLWEVILTEYSPANKKIADAMERMARVFPDATFRFFPGDDVAYARCRIVIPDTEILRRYPGP